MPNFYICTEKNPLVLNGAQNTVMLRTWTAKKEIPKQRYDAVIYTITAFQA